MPGPLRSLFGLILALALAAGATRAEAGLPEGSVVVTHASTIGLRALPGLIRLDSGSFSALELVEAFGLGIDSRAQAMFSYTVGESSARLVDPKTFLPPSPAAYYYDPALHDTLAVQVFGSWNAAGEPLFQAGTATRSLSELLVPAGAVLVFPAQTVPEPGAGSMLLGGGLWLVALCRRSASDDAIPAKA
jgi:hypothetical protein